MDMIGGGDHGTTSTSMGQPGKVARGSAGAHRAALLAAIALAATVGWLVGHSPAAALAADPELTRLLRMMALLKMAMAVGATALVGWRLGFPAGLRVAAGYIGAATLMAAGPPLMWGMAHVVAGGLVFHAGLALLIGLGWRDGMRRVVERRR